MVLLASAVAAQTARASITFFLQHYFRDSHRRAAFWFRVGPSGRAPSSAGAATTRWKRSGALILLNPDDEALRGLVASRQLHQLAAIPEPADPPYFFVMER
jgi:hypothetical protein